MLKHALKLIFIFFTTTSLAFSAGLHDAIHNGDINKVKTLLDIGADIESTDGGSTPLSVAVTKLSDYDMLKKGNEQNRQNLLEIVEVLISSGAKINRRINGYDRQNPVLHDAVFGYNVDLVKLLLDSGASVKTKSKDGNYPVLSALDTKTFAIHIGVSAQYADKDDMADLAAEAFVWSSSRKVMVQLLMQYGAKINVMDDSYFSESALHKAVSYGLKDTVQLLVEYGVNTNVKNHKGRTPLYVAINDSSPDEEIINILKNVKAIRAEKKELIKEAQTQLKEKGYYTSTIDGLYGKKHCFCHSEISERYEH